MERKIKSSIRCVDLGELAGVIRGGGVVVLPTDTIYGFHCCVSCSGAVRRVKELKGGVGRKGFILLASDIRMVDGLVSHWPGDSRDRLSDIWPAPLTAILPASGLLPEQVVSGGSVAVRIPAREWLRRLISMVREPLVSTSVNRSGSSPLTRISEILERFPGLDYYVSSIGRAATSPSTIVDFTGDGIVVVRSGRYRFDVD